MQKNIKGNYQKTTQEYKPKKNVLFLNSFETRVCQPGGGPTFAAQKVVKGASKLKFGGQGFVSGIRVVVLSRKMMVWASKIIYFGLLRYLYEYFLKNGGKTVAKGGNFTLFNADWGAIIIGGSLEVGELLKSRGWWAPTQPTPPGWQTLIRKPAQRC